MEHRMSAIETRLNTILPKLATKDDLNYSEYKLNSASKYELTILESKISHTIHQELFLIREEINSNNWRTITWTTTVVGIAFFFAMLIQL